VTKLRASDGQIMGTLAVTPPPFGLAFDGANIWVSTPEPSGGGTTVRKL